jgi:pimeloyl-ACP methyl ester carboxylesterase
VPKDPARISIARFADDGHAVLRAAGAEGAIVCGLSMGVQVALEHARRNPSEPRGLVLICGTAGRPLGRISLAPSLTRQVARGARLIPRGGFLSRAAFAPLLKTPLGRELAYLTGGAHREDCPRELLDELFADIAKMDLDVVGAEVAAYLEHDAWDVLPSLRVPALIIAGGGDQLTPASTAEKMARLAPRATLHVVAGRTHLAQIEAPDEVHAVVDRFLAREGLSGT